MGKPKDDGLVPEPETETETPTVLTDEPATNDLNSADDVATNDQSGLPE